MEELSCYYNQQEYCCLPENKQLHTNSPLIYANSNFQSIDKIRAVVVEDQELIVIGIKKALEQYENIEIVGDAFNAKHGLTLLNNLKPKIAIVDICLPD